MRFGIDFGTTHTVVAMIDRGNYPVVSFEHGDAIPSLAAVDAEGELHFGHAAPGWTALRSFKRLLNEAHPDAEVRIGSASLPLADLLARFLSHVRDEIVARSNAGLRKKDALEVAVSVPANASTAQRLMTMDAYRRAGFDVKAVLNEPSAAGFEYAHRFRDTLTSKREYVLVYDLGGGTFDASLIHMEGKSNEVITSSGISRLGGDDFDEAIAQLVLEKRGGGALTEHLLDEVRGYKESLTPNTRKFAVDEVVVPVDEVYARCMPLVEETLGAMEPAMRDPRREGDQEVAWSELAGIYVVGGASSFPPVYRRLREKFGAHRVRRSPHPFGSCAIGLAIHLDEMDGEADGAGPEGMWRAPHAVGAELLAQAPVDGRERRGAAHHVDARQLAPGHLLVALAPRVAHGRLHGPERLFHQRHAAGVDLVHRDHDLVDRELARVGGERFFVSAHLVEQVLGERAAAALLQHQLRNGLVEVVAAQARDAAGGDHLVALALHVDERGVEGAASQVVDQDVLALAGQRLAKAVRVLEARRAGLVEHGLHVEARAAVGIHGHQALRGGSVGGNADGDLQRVLLAQPGVGAGDDLVAHVAEETREQIGERKRRGPDAHLRVGVRLVEQPLERSQRRPARRGVAKVELALRIDRRERRDGVAVLEGDDRIVAAVDHRDDGVGGPEVDAEPHARSLAIW